jgi:hypothetical protein
MLTDVAVHRLVASQSYCSRPMTSVRREISFKCRAKSVDNDDSHWCCSSSTNCSYTDMCLSRNDNNWTTNVDMRRSSINLLTIETEFVGILSTSTCCFDIDIRQCADHALDAWLKVDYCIDYRLRRLFSLNYIRWHMNATIDWWQDEQESNMLTFDNKHCCLGFSTIEPLDSRCVM